MFLNKCVTVMFATVPTGMNTGNSSAGRRLPSSFHVLLFTSDRYLYARGSEVPFSVSASIDIRVKYKYVRL